MLKELEVKGFRKFDSKVFDLSKPVLLTGKNGSGKSSVLDSVMFAVLGATSNGEQKNAEIFKDCNNDFSMCAKVVADNSIEITRQLYKKENSKTISEELYFSGLTDPKAKITEKNSAIIKELGINPVFFNVNNFLTMSTSDKSKIIYELISNQDKDFDYLKKKIEVIPCDSSIKNEVLSWYNSKISIEDNVNTLFEKVNTLKNATNKEVKAMISTSEQLADLRNRCKMDDSISKSIASLNDEINKLSTELEIIQNDNKKTEQLKNRLEIARTNLVLGNLTALEKSQQTVSDNIQKLSEKKFDENMQKKIADIDLKINDALEELQNIKVEGVSAAEKINTKNLLGRKLENTSINKCCVIDPSIPCINGANFKKSMNDLLNEIKTIRKCRQELAAKYKALQAKINKYKEERKDLVEKDNENRKAIQENQKRLSTLNKEFMDISVKIENTKKAKEEYKGIENALKYSKPIQNTLLKEQVLSAKKAQLKQLEEKQKDDNKVRQNLLILEQNEKNRKIKENNLDAYKKIEKELKTIKSDLVNSGIKPFVDDMNYIFNELKFDYKFYVEGNKKNVDFGIIKISDNNRKIPFKHTSLGESVIILIALMATIYKKQNTSLKLLALDNIENLDNSNLQKIFDNIEVLNKYFDNIILSGVLDDRNIEFNENVSINHF